MAENSIKLTKLNSEIISLLRVAACIGVFVFILVSLLV